MRRASLRDHALWMPLGMRRSRSKNMGTSGTDLGGGVAGARDERPHVWRQGETHDVTSVTVERRRLLTGLNVPQRTDIQHAHTHTHTHTHQRLSSSSSRAGLKTCLEARTCLENENPCLEKIRTRASIFTSIFMLFT